MTLFLLICAAFSAMLGFANLALSQDRHWEGTGMPGSPPVVRLRRIGAALIAGSAFLILVRDGVSFAILFWPLLVGCMALLSLVVLTWHPRLFQLIAEAVIAIKNGR